MTSGAPVAGSSGRARTRFIEHPWPTAAVLTGALFVLTQLLLRPGYWINDDVKIAWNIAGYPGIGSTTPFAIHLNVILGFLLAALYSLPSDLNWYTILLGAINAVSVVVILGMVLSPPGTPAARLPALVVLIPALASLTQNMTYTASAMFASVAGIGLLLRSTISGDQSAGLQEIGGAALIVVGLLLRPPMFLMAAAIWSPTLVGFQGVLDRRRLAMLCILVGALALLTLGVDRLYVRTAPDWNLFYAHTRWRQNLHDPHRLNNLHAEIRRIGWTPNDQELFARWFYPDEQRYSIENIRYLVQHVSPVSHDPLGTLVTFGLGLTRLSALALLLGMLASFCFAIALRVPARSMLALVLALAMGMALNAVASLVYKDPVYVQESTLGSALSVSLLMLVWAPHRHGDRTGAPMLFSRRLQVLSGVGWAMAAGSAVLMIASLIATSLENVANQQEYARIREEMSQLQEKGVLGSSALIVSPAHGLPYEWSYPFTLDRPSPAYLDTGWLTFSPTYYKILAHFGIASLPLALLQRDDIYLMAEESLTVFIARYYREHFSLDVDFREIYAMPNPRHRPGYDDIRIYSLHAKGGLTD